MTSLNQFLKLHALQNDDLFEFFISKYVKLFFERNIFWFLCTVIFFTEYIKPFFYLCNMDIHRLIFQFFYIGFAKYVESYFQYNIDIYGLISPLLYNGFCKSRIANEKREIVRIQLIRVRYGLFILTSDSHVAHTC